LSGKILCWNRLKQALQGLPTNDKAPISSLDGRKLFKTLGVSLKVSKSVSSGSKSFSVCITNCPELFNSVITLYPELFNSDLKMW